MREGIVQAKTIPRFERGIKGLEIYPPANAAPKMGDAIAATV
jgi:hypothetical protein